MKKTGLGKDPLSWITPTSIEKEETETKTRNVVVPKKRSSKENIPKFQTFDVRLTSLLREDQLEFLEKLIRDIQKNRTSEFKKERITKNTLIRVFIDVFMDIEINTSNISDEETLLERVKEQIYQ